MTRREFESIQQSDPETAALYLEVREVFGENVPAFQYRRLK